jgi:DNA mismatch repair protein MutL
VPVEGRGGEDIGLVEVRGLVSAPTLSRSSRDGMHLTVNGRAIAPRGQLGAIVEEAYQTLLMKGRFPLVVLQLQVHPAAVDVNVHPTKSEVKFRNPQHIARVLGQAVRSAVQGTVVIQGWADDTAPAPSAAEPPSAPPPPAERAAPAPTMPPPAAPPPPAAQPTPIQATLMAEPQRFESEADLAAPSTAHRERPADADWRVDDRERAAPQRLHEAPAKPYRTPPPVEPPAADVARTAAPDTDASETPPVEPPAARLPSLRALAQLAQTYLLTEGPDGALYLIDQHAAHERITYERLLARHRAGAAQAQTLLLPQLVSLPPHARQALLSAAEELASWGLLLDDAEGGVEVRAVPAGLALEDLPTVLADLASHVSGAGGSTPAERQDATLATLACHTSVRAGQTLTLLEQQALIDQLAGCDGPRTCPHGRPTLIVITPHQLERQFGRLGA